MGEAANSLKINGKRWRQKKWMSSMGERVIDL